MQLTYLEYMAFCFAGSSFINRRFRLDERAVRLRVDRAAH